MWIEDWASGWLMSWRSNYLIDRRRNGLTLFDAVWTPTCSFRPLWDHHGVPRGERYIIAPAAALKNRLVVHIDSTSVRVQHIDLLRLGMPGDAACEGDQLYDIVGAGEGMAS